MRAWPPAEGPYLQAQRRSVAMSQADPNQGPVPLSPRMDPAWGAVVGTFLLAMCLAGPVGLVLAAVAWLVIEALRRRKSPGVRPSSPSEPPDDGFTARFQQLEDDIVGDD